MKLSVWALSSVAMMTASVATAEVLAEDIVAYLTDEGYAPVTIESSETQTEVTGEMGDTSAVVVIDNATQTVIAEGKYRNGARIGDDVVPDKLHKADGVKYGDQDKDRETGAGSGEREHADDGVGGGDHTGTREQAGK